MDRYAVLVFHGQKLTDEQQMAFSREFRRARGRARRQCHQAQDKRLATGMNDVSNLGKDGKPLARDSRQRLFNLGNMLWHSDSSFRADPGQVFAAVGARREQVGGNTEFADMRAAYDALDDDTKARDRGPRVRALADVLARLARVHPARSQEERALFRPVRQSLVRTHPVTARKSLYLSSHAGTIVGVPMAEASRGVNDL